MAQRYRPVSTNENQSQRKGLVPGRRFKDSKAVARFNNIVHSLFWIGVSVAIIYYTDLVKVVQDEEKVFMPFIQASYFFMLVFTLLMLYCTIYLPYIARITVPWEQHIPQAIPISTICGLLTIFSSIIGLWPTFGALSIFIVIFLAFGAIMAPNFLVSLLP